MKILIPAIFLISLSILSACNSKDKNNTSKDETSVPAEEISSEDGTQTYAYPKNLFSDAYNLGFYLIGFNSTGQVAYIDRPCNGGCGCCVHDIIIQDLTTDKKVATLNLINPGADATEDHKKDWVKNKDKISEFLSSYGIVQKSLYPNKSNLINYNNNTYKISSDHYMVNEQSAMTGNKMIYSASVLLNNIKSKIVTSGKENDGEAFDYLGYIKSPFSNQLALLFNKRYKGFEAEIINEVIVVGCIMDTQYF